MPLPSEGSRPVVDDPGVTPPLGGETVLVVDDDPAILRVASRVLSRGGYRVLEATSGVEALEIAERHEGEIHLLLTDVVLPGMGGGEISQRVSARFPDTCILFMSGQIDAGSVLRGVPAGEVNFLPKPFTVQGLRSRVREILDGRFH
ncbi:MAG: response regulator [Gemmatimonadota bacterium]|jgi:two-component system cell cycle sensor histidine kinase/response regulator CckA